MRERVAGVRFAIHLAASNAVSHSGRRRHRYQSEVLSRHQLWSPSGGRVVHVHTLTRMWKKGWRAGACAILLGSVSRSPAEEAALINSRGRSRYRRRTIKITVFCGKWLPGGLNPVPVVAIIIAVVRAMSRRRIRQSPATPADCRSLLLLLLSRAVSW